MVALVNPPCLPSNSPLSVSWLSTHGANRFAVMYLHFATSLLANLGTKGIMSLWLSPGVVRAIGRLWLAHLLPVPRRGSVYRHLAPNVISLRCQSFSSRS